MSRSTLTLLLVLLCSAAQADSPSLERYLNIRSCQGGAPLAGQGTAFLTNVTGVNQIWTVNAPASWATQLTFETDRVARVEASPDGKWLLFERDQGGDEHNQLYLLSATGGVPVALTANRKAIHTFGDFSPDGKSIAYVTTERNGTDFDAIVMDLASRSKKVVYNQGGSAQVACFSPDGKSLIVSKALSNVDFDLYRVDLADGKLTHLTPHQGPVFFGDVQWGADNTLYLACDLKREFAGLARMDASKGISSLEFLEPDRQDVDALALAPDGKTLAVAHNREGYSSLTVGGQSVALANGVVDGGGFQFSSDGQRLIFTFTSPIEPANVYSYELASGKLTNVTRSTLAGVDPSGFVSPTLIKYPSFDGKEIPAFYYQPPGVSKPPAVISVHGGPEAQTRAHFSGLTQYFLSRGYAILAPNVRGSTGYGRTYTHLDDVRLRMDSVKDLEYANRWLSERAGKIAVMGGSYGGYMTLAAVTYQPERWAAGVDIVGISNFISFLNNTGSYRRALRIAEYGDPVKDAEFLREVSPFFHVEKIRAPMLIIQGANDPRVPQSESDQMVASLKARSLPVEYLLYKDEGHGLAKLSNRIDAYAKVVEFLDKHLK
ncbi:MAG: peptidase [Candidatus Xenobia bacterium]